MNFENKSPEKNVIDKKSEDINLIIESNNINEKGELVINFKKQFSQEEQESFIKDAIQKGVGYIIPSKTVDYYSRKGLIYENTNLPSGNFLPKNEQDLSFPVSIMKPLGIMERSETISKEINNIEKNLTEFYRLVEAYYEKTYSWIRDNSKDFPNHCISALGIDRDPLEPVPVPKFFPESLFRTDSVVNNEGRLMVCDPNVMPLGMAYADYARRYFRMKNEIQDYINALAEASKEGINGVITDTKHPSWTNHSYIASRVREAGGNFHVIHPAFIDENGLINKDVPHILIRHIREEIELNKNTRVINQKGISLYESPLWTAMRPLIKKEDRNIFQSIVPGILVKKDTGKKKYLFAESMLDSERSIDFSWKEVNDNILNELLDNYKISVKSRTGWFIKAIQTSGSKGVGFLPKGKDIQKRIDNFMDEKGNNFGNIFILQPPIQSAISVNGESRRAKIDSFFFGDPKQKLNHISTNIFVAPKSHRKVHGGSETSIILVE